MNFSYSWRRLDIACWMSERCCHVVSGGSGLVWLFTSGSRPPLLTFSEPSSSITHTPGIASSPTTQSVIRLPQYVMLEITLNHSHALRTSFDPCLTGCIHYVQISYAFASSLVILRCRLESSVSGHWVLLAQSWTTLLNQWVNY